MENPGQKMDRGDGHHPKNPQTVNSGEGMEKSEPSCWQTCKLKQPLWRTVSKFLEKLGLKLPCDPEVPLLGICHEKTAVDENTCIRVHRGTVYNSWGTERPRCPSTDEWIEKPWHINTAYKKECIGLSSNRMDEPR